MAGMTLERREGAEKPEKKKKRKAKKKVENVSSEPVPQNEVSTHVQSGKPDGFTVVKKGALMSVQPQSLDTTMSLLAMQLDASSEEAVEEVVEDLDEWTQ